MNTKSTNYQPSSSVNETVGISFEISEKVLEALKLVSEISRNFALILRYSLFMAIISLVNGSSPLG